MVVDHGCVDDYGGAVGIGAVDVGHVDPCREFLFHDRVVVGVEDVVAIGDFEHGFGDHDVIKILYSPRQVVSGDKDKF